MSKLTIQSGKHALNLKKSNTLVGLKTVETVETSEQEYVEKEVIKNLGGFNVVTLNGVQNVDEQLDEVRQKQEVEIGTHVYYVEGSDRPLVATGELFIVFQTGTSQEEQAIVLDEFQLELVEQRTEDQIIVRVTSRSPNPFKVASALQEISMVKLAEPDLDTVLDEYFTAPKDDLLDHLWQLENTGFVSDVNFRLKKGADAKVMDAWRRLGNTGSSNVVVAVIDNGFDLSHPDLKAKVYRPYDLWNQSSKLLQGDRRFTHGTPCASVAIAASNNNGIVGVAPNSKFMPISGTSFNWRATEQMFDYCVRNGADIISCSWGTTDDNFALDSIKEEAITKAARKGRNGKGCIILFAVGNDDKEFVNFYAAHPDVIAVAACTSQDEHAEYSNRGREVSVCAPSNGDWPIIAARAWWDEGIASEVGNFRYWRDGRSRGKHYKHFGGTSASTPLVAGICALMLSANPDLTAREVKQILQSTADKIGPSWEYRNGHSRKFGYGRVNADKAVAEAMRRRDRSSGNSGSSSSTTVSVEPKVTSGSGLFKFDVKRQASKGFGVQIGVYAEYGNVLIQAEKLQRQFGEDIIVNINELNGKTVYKVLVGAFSSQNNARKLLQRMKNAGVSGFIKNLADLK